MILRKPPPSLDVLEDRMDAEPRKLARRSNAARQRKSGGRCGGWQKKRNNLCLNANAKRGAEMDYLRLLSIIATAKIETLKRNQSRWCPRSSKGSKTGRLTRMEFILMCGTHIKKPLYLLVVLKSLHLTTTANLSKRWRRCCQRVIRNKFADL